MACTIGDSTFIHSGITGLVDLIFNPPATGHVILILDNGTTAMTGLQEHPGTGRTLDHKPTGKVIFEELVHSLGISRIFVVNPIKEQDRLETLITESLAKDEPTVIITRQPCLLAAKKIKQYANENSNSRGQNEENSH